MAARKHNVGLPICDGRVMITVMTYRQRELARLAELAIERWPAQAMRRPPYVLAPHLAGDNLLAGIRDPALHYFDEHQIRWWLSRAKEAERAALAAPIRAPTGHLNSAPVEDAVSPAESSYSIFRDLGDLLLIVFCVCRFARVLSLAGKPEPAARVLASAAREGGQPPRD